MHLLFDKISELFEDSELALSVLFRELGPGRKYHQAKIDQASLEELYMTLEAAATRGGLLNNRLLENELAVLGEQPTTPGASRHVSVPQAPQWDLGDGLDDWDATDWEARIGPNEYCAHRFPAARKSAFVLSRSGEADEQT